MNNNYVPTGIFVGLVFLLINDITSKFIIGFIAGIFVSTKYDFKPYVSLIEDKVTSFQKELELKREQKPQMDNWGLSWLFKRT